MPLDNGRDGMKPQRALSAAILALSLGIHGCSGSSSGSNDTANDGPTVSEVARTLRHNRVHRVLVIENDVLVGLIATFDLVELLEKDDGGQT